MAVTIACKIYCWVRQKLSTGSPLPIQSKMFAKRSSFELGVVRLFTRHYTDINSTQLREKLKNGGLLIDVREPPEIVETGTISLGSNRAKNVPLDELAKALTLSQDDFKNKYGFDKPGPSQEIIFTCKAGKRSPLAAAVAEKLAYSKVINFPEGVYGWKAANKKV